METLELPPHIQTNPEQRRIVSMIPEEFQGVYMKLLAGGALEPTIEMER